MKHDEKATQKQADREELKAVLKEKQEEFVSLQQTVKEHKLPVLVLVEGWGAAGKGTLIGNLIGEMDPRFYNVIPMNLPSAEDKRHPFLYRYMEQIPENGKFVFLDSGWMKETIDDMMHDRLGKDELEARFETIRIFERQLVDNGYLVIKLFLQISEKEQKKRVEKLLSDKDTSWRVGKSELNQLKERKAYEKAFKKYLSATDTPYLPWDRIDASDEKSVKLQALNCLLSRIHARLDAPDPKAVILDKDYPLLPMQPLSQVPLDQEMSREEYKKELKSLQKKLKELHNRIYRAKIPVVIAYEGWDAAGKGGNIKRLTSALDPRGFDVHPIASPEPHEKARHYLWRFWTRLPKDGHIAIFDRSWYGRVMVERIEGFCSENDWERAYNEINEFEKELSDWGAIVIKFWVQIDSNTQLARFTERQNTPSKQWKITDEDWRNREKWDQYEIAVNEMLQKTSTKNAPWYIIPSNNKSYARIQAIRIVIDEIEKRLKH